tara:strand:- start:66 stop:782 length:717 start_codon:yes stop_codon:yes gene_type:complete
MNKNISGASKNYYENNYNKHGLSFQRKYPNEEFCRFMGRTYFHENARNRKKIRILEVGCGSAGNLKLIVNEGFDSYGIDISKKSISLLKQNFKNNKKRPILKVADMKKIPFTDSYFDCIIDVFSSTHLNAEEGNIFIKEIQRCLKHDGLFYSYFPSKKSDIFKLKKKIMLDKDTIFKLNEKQSAYRINKIPFRFLSSKQYSNILNKENIETIYKEEITKTYFFGSEKFVFLSVVGKKY